MGYMRRRDFIKSIAGAAVVRPLAVAAQQPAMSIVGYLSNTSPDAHAPYVAALRQVLNEAGYIENENLAMEYRWAQGENERLQGLAADLVRRRPAVLVAAGTPPAIMAKAATSTVPIVFTSGSDPIQVGLVPNLTRPGANVTGISAFSATLRPKRLELLHELLPKATNIAVLENPNHVSGSARDFEQAFYSLATGRILPQGRAEGILVAGDPLTISKREQLIALAARYSIPVMYEYREFTEIGGLISYGPNLSDIYRQAGSYAGQILKGASPGDLPVVQQTKFELVINLKTAKALGLTVPPMLLGRATETIE
jgi:putative ABC transport system substrate-binding protein